MPYASPDDMLLRYDARTIGDLVNDNNNRQTPTQLQTNAALLAALSSASGEINSATLYGERYTVLELQSLTGDDQEFLTALNCDLAFGRLNLRRGNDPAKFPAFIQAKELLERLRQGSLLFNVAGDVATGVVAEEFPSYTTYATVNLVRDFTRGRFFPVRRYQQGTSGGTND